MNTEQIEQVRTEFKNKPVQEQKRLATGAAKVVIERIAAGGKFVIHECSMCEYPCGYYIMDAEIRYDNGCDCTVSYRSRPAGVPDLVEDFMMNPHLIELTMERKPWGRGKSGEVIAI